MEFAELFWGASIEELKNGYSHSNEIYTCLSCGKSFEEGLIYRSEETLLEAKKAVEEHIKQVHGSVFQTLMDMGHKYTGLSEQQQEIMSNFFKGLDDGEISRLLKINRSTVRNHRFRLKEKAKQAKIFLALFELMEEKVKTKDKIIDIPRTATMIDERYAITAAERDEKVAKFFDEVGRLTKFPKKEKDKLIVLMEMAKAFKGNIAYSEKEVNQVLKNYYDDYVLLRRYLIEYGFIARKADGSSYWVIF